MNRLAAEVGALAIAFGSAGWAQVTQRVSVGSVTIESGGVQASKSIFASSISADGRYVVFESFANNLVPGTTNHTQNIFLRDRRFGWTELVSVDSNGEQADSYGASSGPSISADGRYVAFVSVATNLVLGDTNGSPDVFVRDRQNGTTERMSVDSNGVQGYGVCAGVSISADGRYVAFYSNFATLVPGNTNGGVLDVFVRDRQNGTTELVSVDTGGMQGNLDSFAPSISADGRFVAFLSDASNLVPGDTNGATDVFVRDRQTGTTELVSVSLFGQQGWYTSDSTPSMSADGRYVAFDWSWCDMCGRVVFVRDRQSGTTRQVSVDSNGVPADDESGGAVISDDGRCVAFWSYAHNLLGDFVQGDTNGFYDVYVRDLQSGTTERVSVGSGAAQGNADSYYSSISADGRFVAFHSEATNFVQGDTNDQGDIFVRDRALESFASLCEPGASGVIGCPCSNPPAGPERGCDNSSATGGASLSVSGGEYLTSDSIVFTTSGEKPASLSLLVQGTSSLPSGAVYGQGVRCVAGTLTRLYTKISSYGSITAPDFSAGDATVHLRSEALGDPILLGSRRWYTVVYRDPIVLGGCSAASTFNASQSREIRWAP